MISAIFVLVLVSVSGSPIEQTNGIKWEYLENPAKPYSCLQVQCRTNCIQRGWTSGVCEGIYCTCFQICLDDECDRNCRSRGMRNGFCNGDNVCVCRV